MADDAEEGIFGIESVLSGSWKVQQAFKLFSQAQAASGEEAIAKYQEVAALAREAIPELTNTNWLGRAYCVLADALYRQPPRSAFDWEDYGRRSKEALMFFERAIPILERFNEDEFATYARDMALHLRRMQGVESD